MRSIAVCLSLALFLLSAPVSANTDKLTADAPDAFIAQLRDVSVEQLTDRSIEADERRARFQSLLNEGFDVEAVSSFVLARPRMRKRPISSWSSPTC